MILQNVRKICNYLLQITTKSNILKLFVAEHKLLSFRNRISALRLTMQMSLVYKISVPGIQIIQIDEQTIKGWGVRANYEWRGRTPI